ncbi:MAG: hypothetical protein WBB00_16745 [Mycobacterium sp.]
MRDPQERDDSPGVAVRAREPAAPPHTRQRITGNDDRPRPVQRRAQQADHELLTDIIRRVLDRHDQRLTARAEAWAKHSVAA